MQDKFSNNETSLSFRGRRVINTLPVEIKSKSVRKVTKAKESNLQQSCVKWFKLQYPKLSKRLWSTPNGGFRNVWEAARLKREGTIPGVPDLFLAVLKMGYGGLFIEMKSEKGKLSDSQKEFFKEMCYDYRCVVVKSLDEFIKEIKDYLN